MLSPVFNLNAAVALPKKTKKRQKSTKKRVKMVARSKGSRAPLKRGKIRGAHERTCSKETYAKKGKKGPPKKQHGCARLRGFNFELVKRHPPKKKNDRKKGHNTMRP